METSGSVPPPSRVSQFLDQVRAAGATSDIIGPDESGAFPPRWSVPAGVVVVDANIIRSDVLYACRAGRRTTLVSAANEGLLRLYSAPHVIDEVQEHHRRWADDGPVSAANFWRRWATEYLPLLQVVEVPSGLLSAAEVSRIEWLTSVDPDDVPSVTLTLLLGGFFLSEDARAWRAAYGEQGSADQRRQWLGVLQAGGNAGELTALLHGGMFGGALAGHGLTALVRSVLRRPWLLVPMGVVAGAAAAGWTPERTAKLRSFGRQLLEIFAEISVVQTTAAAQFQQACVQIPDWQDLSDELTPRSLLARALMLEMAKAKGGPWSVTEIVDLVPVIPVGHGESTVRAVLQSHRCFVMVSPGRWQLGSYRG